VAMNRPIPIPTKDEVVVKILSSGLCHSDLHIQAGAFPLPLPSILGHEGAGIVVGVGPDVKNTKIGEKVIVYPWFSLDIERNYLGSVGCGHPEGAFSTHLLVPEERYCIPTQNIPLPQASLLACSGITAYSALKRAKEALTSRIGSPKYLVIIGAGGVGLQAVRLSKIVTGVIPIVCDIDDAKLAIAARIGPKGTITINNKDPKTAESRIVSLTSGCPDVVIDFVGSTGTNQFGLGLLSLKLHKEKNGKYIVVGLFDGEIKLPLVVLITRKITVEGSFTGTLEEMKELVSIVAKEKGLVDIPVVERGFDEVQVNNGLQQMKEGITTGRIIFSSKL